MTNTLTKSDLLHFTGSETWYRHGLAKDILYTDGAQYVAEQGGAYWLLDEIALAQQFRRVDLLLGSWARGLDKSQSPHELIAHFDHGDARCLKRFFCLGCHGHQARIDRPRNLAQACGQLGLAQSAEQLR